MPSRSITFVLSFLLSGAALAAAPQELCFNCHGKDGASADSSVPVIAGISAATLTDQIKTYREAQRPCPETAYLAGDKKGTKTTMCAIAKSLSVDEAAAVATFFAGKKFVRPPQTPNAALAAKGKEIHATYCEKCHSEGGSAADDDASILAGQWMPYLTAQFRDFRSGARPPNAKMKVKLDQLQPADFDALVNYYGNFK